MGRIYFVGAILDIKLDDHLVKSILTQGSKLGMQYYARKTPESSVEKNLSINEAHDIITNKLNSSDNFLGPSGSIDFNMHDNQANLYFAPKDRYLTYLSIGSANIPWCKDPSDNNNDRILNWVLYITILINICKDFAILELSSHDEYFNWD